MVSLGTLAKLILELTNMPLCSVLVDEQASKTGDLYIRSVCFSPDGKYLATGAEDKQIRVCVPSLAFYARLVDTRDA